ncbi:MAG: 50S ribosomal protein L19 [Cytophagia bacterium]|nr:MAG: 50S ribosomal protein L19 [Cytophagales bacterium]TAG05132.1 MAG: 50S ribosomal protein L19 [Cytophagia bacterium]TAG44169.1 MAG: 50S ribosomal protein L19 [Cytophagia bacterium]TAH29557.1 MAG: 50S ribosomal protein L19 [Cytophagales bacterium]
MNALIKKLVESENVSTRAKYPDFKSGDTINVHVTIREGNKERVQQFKGIVIQRKNRNTNGETFTVRKVSNGVGVERVFPILSPNIATIELIKQGFVRRARIYYMRGKMGKAARVKDKKVKDKKEVVAE